MKQLILLFASVVVCQAASTRVLDTIQYPDGTYPAGRATISWGSFTSASSVAVAGGERIITITSGVVDVRLEPNLNAIPASACYTVTYNLPRGSYQECWVVPVSATAVTVSSVRTVAYPTITTSLSQIATAGLVAGDILYFNGAAVTRLPRSSVNGQALTIDTSLSTFLKWATVSGSGGTWGTITGTLSAQTDLAAALAAKLAISNNLSDLGSASTARTNLGLGTAALSAASAFAATSHVHAASDVTSGQFAIARLASGTPTGLKFIRDDGVLATPSGSGNMASTSGSSDPSSACTPGTDYYFQTVSIDVWFCGASGAWRKFLSTLNTGPFVNVGLAGTLPSTPASGYVTEYFDSTAKVPQAVDDAGAKSTMVRPLAAVASNWLRSIGTDGTPTASQPAFSDLSGTASTAQIAANAVTSAKMAVVNTRRTACIPIGANNAAAVIATADLGPQSNLYFINSAQTLIEITVRADGGTPNVIVGRDRAGTIVNLTSSALATAASGGRACAKGTAVTGLDGATTCSATLQNTALAAGDWITLVSGTPGGTAKEMTACLTTTVD